MSDIFERLVARAWDTAPRVRPQIAPRFAPRASALPVEEIEQELYTPSPDASADAEGRWATPVAARAEVPSHEGQRSPEPVAPAVDSPVRRTTPAEPQRSAVPDPAPMTLERTLERIYSSSVERTRTIEVVQPVAAPPPPLRAADIALLRPLQSGDAPSPSRAAALPQATVTPSVTVAAEAQAAHDAIHVSIGRIEVRATAATPLAPAAPRPKHTPLGLEEYLRRRNDER